MLTTLSLQRTDTHSLQGGTRETLILAAANELSKALSPTDTDSLLFVLETVTRQNLQTLSKTFSATTLPSLDTDPTSEKANHIVLSRVK